jgi:hypothetical protein
MPKSAIPSVFFGVRVSLYGHPQKRVRLYESHGDKEHSHEKYNLMINLSRSRVALFIECPCCFYKTVKWNVRRPDSLPFTLNNAVDTLLKKEFDHYRMLQIPHPLVSGKGMSFVPAQLPQIEEWRNPRKGIRYRHEGLGLELYGAVDDIWKNGQGQLVVVDYKATARQEMVTELNNGYHIHYKRQMEFYQWLFAMNGYDVDPTGYFVYCTGRTQEAGLNGVLQFDISLIPYTSSWDWIEDVLGQIFETLNSDTVPAPNSDCAYCRYIRESHEAHLEHSKLPGDE